MTTDNNLRDALAEALGSLFDCYCERHGKHTSEMPNEYTVAANLLASGVLDQFRAAAWDEGWDAGFVHGDPSHSNPYDTVVNR